MRPTPPLRVAHVEGGSRSGSTGVVLALLRHHDRARIAPSLCTFSIAPDPTLADDVLALALPFAEVRKRSRYELGAIDRLSRALGALRPDVAVLHGFGAYSFGALAARQAGVPVVVRVDHQPELVSPLQTLVSAAAAGCSDSTIVVSRWLLAALAARGVVLPAPEVLHNGVDLERFAAVERPPLSGDGPPRALMVARLDTAKDHPTLLQALALVRSRGVPLELELAGDGPLRGALEAQAASLGLGDAVRFLGRRSDLVALFQRADLAVLSTHFEGFGLAIVEAMAAGRPVIATRVAAVPELVDDGRTGLLVPPGDPGALASTLERLIASPSEARALAEAGRRAAARFALEPWVRAFEAHLLRTAARRGLRPECDAAGEPPSWRAAT